MMVARTLIDCNCGQGQRRDDHSRESCCGGCSGGGECCGPITVGTYVASLLAVAAVSAICTSLYIAVNMGGFRSACNW
jgi:hypothetical protein